MREGERQTNMREKGRKGRGRGAINPFPVDVAL
jgi:hypothetical protein